MFHNPFENSGLTLNFKSFVSFVQKKPHKNFDLINDEKWTNSFQTKQTVCSAVTKISHLVIDDIFTILLLLVIVKFKNLFSGLV